MSIFALGAAFAVFACRDITAPQHSLPQHPNRLLNPSGVVVVSPANMRGWAFINDQANTACTDATVCRFVQGPAGVPAGSGSAELATNSTTDGVALVLQDYQGTRLDAITDLRYATYRQSVDSGNNLAIALQLNVDYDLTDQATGYQGRLVFEPYQGTGGNVPQGTWQTWDAKAGRWWGTRASVTVNGVSTANPCVQSAPCTWTQVLTAFPNAGIHASYGAIVLKAGSGWSTFRGNVDQLTIGVNSVATTFDFELNGRAPVTLVPPDTIPKALFDSLGVVMTTDPAVEPGPYRRDIVMVAFRWGTPLAERQAAIDSIGGQVVGGRRNFEDPSDGVYYVRISGGTFDALVDAVAALHRQPQVDFASWLALFMPDIQRDRRRSSSSLRPPSG